MEFIHTVNQWNTMNKRLEQLETQCNQMESKLDHIIDLLTENTKNCDKMSEHIDFVETIYEHVKNPLGFICKKINSMITGNHSIDTIKNQKTYITDH